MSAILAFARASRSFSTSAFSNFAEISRDLTSWIASVSSLARAAPASPRAFSRSTLKDSSSSRRILASVSAAWTLAS